MRARRWCRIPAAALVAAAHAAGIRVEPVPGPSAVIAALSASGLAGGEFLFVGFPPPKAGASRTWLERLKPEARLLVCYEAPHRIRATLTAMHDALGDRVIGLARELTKAHEELVVRPISEILAGHLEERGEFTVIVSGVQPNNAPVATPSADSVMDLFGEMTNIGGLSRRGAIRELASRYQLPAREIFALLEEAKNSAE